MNITSVVVATGLMGLVAPGVANMSIQPLIAQRRATNFSIAEASAVAFSAHNEGSEELDYSNLADSCKDKDGKPMVIMTAPRAYDVTCEGGEGKYLQTVTRSFRLAPETLGEYTNPEREFAWEAPPKYSHVECLPDDPWGVMWYNNHLKAGNLDACIPSPAWSKTRYLESNPDDWLYNLSNHGYGQHPDY